MGHLNYNRLSLTAIVASLAISVAAQPAIENLDTEPETFRVSFTYNHEDTQTSPSRVNLAGDFNSWNATATEMRQTTGTLFTTQLTLPRGEYGYKFVINGTQWIQDKANPYSAADTFGGKNSITAVGVPPPANEDNAALPPSVKAEPAGDKKYRVTFTYKDADATKVSLAGNFNHWNAEKNVMVQSYDGVFTFTLILEEGIVPYKFVVDGKNWIQDPENPEGVDDNNNGLNSILRLGSAAQVTVSTQRVRDDYILTRGLVHNPEDIAFLNPMQDGNVVIKLQATANDVEEAWIYDSTSNPHRMNSEFSDERVEMFRASVPMQALTDDTTSPDNGFQVSYSLGAVDGQTRVVFGRDGVTTASAQSTPSLATFTRSINPGQIFTTPDWAREVVWYQLFPERFRNGSAENDPVSSTTTLRKWTSDWWDREQNETGKALEPGVFGRRYGGDIQGMIEKLPYLKELGIGAIYLNPVFEAESLHKYEATDFRHIDDNFGFAGDYAATVQNEDLLSSSTWTFTKSDTLFIDFLKKAHEAGMKVIIDAVFNHTGTLHPAFVDIREKGPNSRFADWYSVTNWDPFEHEGWAGFEDLPEFKENENGFVSPTLKQHLLDITARWMDPNGDGDPSDGIDGWRLDVPNEVSSAFWREWRDHVKAINPQAIIIGEIWDPPAKWLQGDQFDSVMNYQLAQALTRFFTNSGKATDLEQELSKLLSSVPDQSNYVMMNLMGSHDTDRLVSQLNNPGRGYDARNRQQELQPGEYSSEKPGANVYKRMKQLTAVQFALVGAPMIYYGDEAGMWGADDPEDRKPMLWKDLEPYSKPETNHFMEDIHAHFQRCAAIRNSLPALQTGEYETLLADDNRRIFAFRRSTEGQNVVVVTNDSVNQQEAQIPFGEDNGTDNSTFIDVLNDPEVKIILGTVDGKRDTQLQINGASKYRVLNGQLSVTLAPHTTVVLLETK